MADFGVPIGAGGGGGGPAAAPVAAVRYELWYEGAEERVGKADLAHVPLSVSHLGDPELVAIALRDAVHARRRVRDLAHCSAANLRIYLDAEPHLELADDDLLRFVLDGAPDKLRIVAPPLVKAAASPSMLPLRPRSTSGSWRSSDHHQQQQPLSGSGGPPSSRRDSAASTKRESDTVVVFVKTGDQTFPVEVEAAATVDTVKARIAEQEHIPVEQQRLVFGGAEMENGHSISQYGVHQGCELQLVLTLGASS